MKYTIEMVFVVLLAVLIASCETTSPYEELEPEPEKIEKVSVLISVEDDVDSTRVTNASIEFNTVGEDPVERYNQKVVSTNGIFDEILEKRDVEIDVYAYADGYQPSDTIRINLSNDVFESIYLTKEAGEPDPDSPGKLDVRAKCVENQEVGNIFVTAENGFTSIKLLRASNREVVRQAEGLSPTDGQEYEFSDVPNGSYIVVASRDNSSDPSESTVAVDCEVQEGPGKIKITGSSCSDPDQSNGLLKLMIENGAESLTVTRNDEVVAERSDIAVGEEIELTGLAVGDYEITAVKNEQTTQITEAVNACDEPINITCPFDVNDGTVISFGNSRIRSDRSKDHSRTDIEDVSLSPGIYTVKLYGYDEHSSRPGQSQTHESFYVSLLSGGTEVAQTPELGDLPNGTVFAERTTTIDDFEIDSAIDAVQGRHPAYPSSGANSLNAMCAAFQKTGDLDTNRAPEADWTYETNGLNAHFTNLSTDPDGDDLSCEWDFGDGSSSSDCDPSHEFESDGDYDVTLTVTDPDGASDSKTKTITVERKLSDEYSHRISIFADRKIWVSDHKNRPEDKLLHYGGARPIMTEQDPFGTVRMKVKLMSEVNGHAFIRIFFDEDETDYIETPILDTESETAGWTTVEVEIDAEEFAGRARDLAGFRVIHGDEINDSKPEGPDKVTFATKHKKGEVTFYWRVELSGAQKMLHNQKKWDTDVSLK